MKYSPRLSDLAAKFPAGLYVSAGSRSIHGNTAARLARLGYLERRMKDPRLGYAALWEYRRIS